MWELINTYSLNSLNFGTPFRGTIYLYTANGARLVSPKSWEEMHGIVDILRNERPMYVYITGAGAVGDISSSREPVGEEES